MIKFDWCQNIILVCDKTWTINLQYLALHTRSCEIVLVIKYFPSFFKFKNFSAKFHALWFKFPHILGIAMNNENLFCIARNFSLKFHFEKSKALKKAFAISCWEINWGRKKVMRMACKRTTHVLFMKKSFLSNMISRTFLTCSVSRLVSWQKIVFHVFVTECKNFLH